MSALFREYDDLVNSGKIQPEHIKWKYYNKRNLNTGLDGLESVLMSYREDKKNYKVYDKATDTTIDFSQHKNEVHYIKQYGDMKVIVPRTRECAIYWGWDTKWCTSRIDRGENNIFENNMFSKYYKDTVVNRLYILKFRDEMYQFHISTYQFMDESDNPIKLFPKSDLLSLFLRDLIAENPSYGDRILSLTVRFELVDTYKSLKDKVTGELRATKYSAYTVNNKYIMTDLGLPEETQEWRDERGDLHREDGPAVVKSDGTKEWSGGFMVNDIARTVLL